MQHDGGCWWSSRVLGPRHPDNAELEIGAGGPGGSRTPRAFAAVLQTKPARDAGGCWTSWEFGTGRHLGLRRRSRMLPVVEMAATWQQFLGGSGGSMPVGWGAWRRGVRWHRATGGSDLCLGRSPPSWPGLLGMERTGREALARARALNDPLGWGRRLQEHVSCRRGSRAWRETQSEFRSLVRPEGIEPLRCYPEAPATALSANCDPQGR